MYTLVDLVVGTRDELLIYILKVRRLRNFLFKRQVCI